MFRRDERGNRVLFTDIISIDGKTSLHDPSCTGHSHANVRLCMVHVRPYMYAELIRLYIVTHKGKDIH